MLNTNSCIICKDSISDPVCKKCYTKQIEILFESLEINHLERKIILKRINAKFPIETLNDIGCILCKKENVSLCRYCFSIILRNILEDLEFSEEIIESLGYGSVYE